MLNLILDAAEKLREWNDIRFFVFGMESAVLCFYIYYTGDFIRKARMRKENELRNDMAYTWALFFLFQAIMSVLIMYADYFQHYLPSLDSRNYFLNLGGVIGLIGIILIALKCEQIMKTHYIVTILLAAICACAILFYKFPTDMFNIFQTIAYTSIILIFYATIRYEIGKYPLLNKQLRIFILGFILMIICQLGRSDVSMNFFYNIDVDWLYNVRFFSDFGLLMSCFLLQYAFTQFPSLFELEWKKYLRELHIVHMKGGNELFSYYFQGGNEDNSEIVGGFMYGINQLVAEITGSETPLNMIKQKENVVCFEKNDKIIVVLIAKEYNEVYSIKLKYLLSKIMLDFGHLLDNWDGNKTIFKPLTKTVEEIFS
ncbi:MAG: hypothetical protein ACTSRZ_11205 [Promethearchaeota archaeon]